MTVDSDTPLSAQAVAEYLQANPDFFEQQTDLLLNLRVPHSSGAAISLVEKQQSILRERNTELRRRLTDLVANARSNDKLFSHTRRLVLALLDCQNLSQAIDAIYASFGNDFGIEKTSIILFTQGSISRARYEHRSVAEEKLGKYLKARQTIGGGIAKEEMAFLFGDDAEQLGSAAIAVLAYGDIFGVIAVANSDPNYYQSSMGTLFLSYISEVLSRVIRDLLPK